MGSVICNSINVLIFLCLSVDSTTRCGSGSSASGVASSGDGSSEASSSASASSYEYSEEEPDDTTCPPNEEYSNCTQAICRALNCSQRGQPVPCSAIEDGSCESGCVCQSGYLRTADGDCIPEDQCYGDLVCDEDETIEVCPGSCFNDFCPRSESDNICTIADPIADPCGQPVCTCRFNEKRDDDGICIPTTDCPPFDCSARPNEEYNSCPPICPTDDCSQASPSGRCPFPGRIGIILECNPSCRCIKGYWRKNGICVPYDECPDDVCPENEEYSNCTETLCRAQNCSQIGEIIVCLENEEQSCEEGCVCVEGTLRGPDGACIPQDQCPKIECGENERLNECTNGCDNDTCPQNLNKNNKDDCFAPAVCGPPECQCMENYKRNNAGACIPIAECPGICSVNEEFSNCTQIVCRAQDCSQRGIPVPCPGLAEGSCQTGCVCKYGTLRNSQGVCVPEDQCDVCPPNEELNNCTQAICRAQNCSQRGQAIACAAVQEGSCETGCVCMPGYLRTARGDCVLEDQCYGDLVCNEDETVDTCPGNCTNDFCPTSENSEVCTIFNPTPNACGSPVCKCRFNYMRSNDNYTCIPTRDCPPFDCSARPNEEYNPCPPFCPSDDCSQATPTGRCPLPGRIGIVLQCIPKCRCINGYWRDNGICVPYAECPGKCPQNEVFSNCTQGLCRAQNCSQKGQPIACPAIAEGSCKQGCVCKEGTLRAENGSCISEDQCPTGICSVNEEFSNCTQIVCRAQDCSQRGRPVPCPGLAEGSCQTGCVCKYGTLRNSQGVCVPEDQCDVCPPNEELNNCTQAICRAQNCSQRGQAIACAAVQEGSCETGCVCMPGYLRTARGDCVLEDQCYGDLVCNENEAVDTCPGNCTNDFCPTSENSEVCPLSNPDVCGSPVCKCRFNYMRSNENDTCIPTTDCPPFDCSARPYEEYNPCPPICPSDDCSQATPTGQCSILGTIGIVLPCTPVCRCIKGYWRNNDICVPYAECPGKCPQNEEFSNCTQALCRAQNCSQKGQPIACPAIAEGSCKQGCVCKEGTLRAANGSCIPEDECPKTKCGKNEKLNECPSVCETDDCPKNFTNSIKACIKICGPTRCECISNYKRDSYGNCIPIEECPEICPVNEEYSSCTQALCRAQNCTQIGQPIACPRIAEGYCQKGCVCKEGTLRDVNGNCVPADQCPGKLVCNENETVDTCPGRCFNDFCPTSENSNVCTLSDPTPDDCGSPVCRCRFNYLRSSDTGTCIPTRDCPPFDCSARPNEEYNPCPPLCPSDDCSQATPTGRCPLPGRIGIVLPCRPKCRCIKGYWRDNCICVPYAECPGKCPQNEVFSNCTQGLCRAQNCSQKGQPIACPAIAEGSCKQGCVCKEGTLRAANGSCIPENQCPVQNICGKNEMLIECTSVCKTDACPKNLTAVEGPCILICGPAKCECVTGYARDDTGNCVPIGECPGICPENQEYSSCTQGVCRAQNCSQIGQPIACPLIVEGSCEEGCVCVEGTLKDDNGNCVPQSQCPGQICGDYEAFNECPSVCNTDACPKNVTSYNAAACSDVCGQPKCECVKNFRRDDNGKCIPIQECPPLVCCDYEEVKECSNRCDDDRCPNLINRTEPCIAPAVCGPPRCQCVEGYKRDSNGDCIPIRKCKQPQCNNPNEVRSCVRSCPPEKTCRNRDIKFSCLQVYTPCVPKCVCKEGFFRNPIGECITGEQCDQCSGKNEYYSCGPECDNVCADLATQNKTNCPFVNIQCNRKCYCEDGYARDEEKYCVPIDQCPKVNKCADPNEEYLDCKRSCPPDHCISLVAKFKCPEKPVCEAGCSCKSGFLREKEGSPCVPICDCPQMKNSPDCQKTVSER